MIKNKFIEVKNQVFDKIYNSKNTYDKFYSKVIELIRNCIPEYYDDEKFGILEKDIIRRKEEVINKIQNQKSKKDMTENAFFFGINLDEKILNDLDELMMFLLFIIFKEILENVNIPGKNKSVVVFFFWNVLSHIMIELDLRINNSQIVNCFLDNDRNNNFPFIIPRGILNVYTETDYGDEISFNDSKLIEQYRMEISREDDSSKNDDLIFSDIWGLVPLKSEDEFINILIKFNKNPDDLNNEEKKLILGFLYFFTKVRFDIINFLEIIVEKVDGYDDYISINNKSMKDTILSEIIIECRKSLNLIGKFYNKKRDYSTNTQEQHRTYLKKYFKKINNINSKDYPFINIRDNDKMNIIDIYYENKDWFQDLFLTYRTGGINLLQFHSYEILESFNILYPSGYLCKSGDKLEKNDNGGYNVG